VTDRIDLLAHFPTGFTPRPEQTRLLTQLADRIEEALEDPTAPRVFLVEAPPGVGKSHVAMALARWSGDAYLLTSQKLLQDQYEREFGADLQLVKGRDNYLCERYPDARVPTSRGMCRRPRGPVCQCPYARAKTAALAGPIFCTNTAYFATLRHWRAEQLRRRRLLIVDEAHNLEAQLVNVFTVAFSPEQAKAWFGGPLPRLDTAEDYRSLLRDHLERMDAQLETVTRALEIMRPAGVPAETFLSMPPSRAEQELMAERETLETALARVRFVDARTASGSCAIRPNRSPPWAGAAHGGVDGERALSRPADLIGLIAYPATHGARQCFGLDGPAAILRERFALQLDQRRISTVRSGRSGATRPAGAGALRGDRDDHNRASARERLDPRAVVRGRPASRRAPRGASHLVAPAHLDRVVRAKARARATAHHRCRRCWSAVVARVWTCRRSCVSGRRSCLPGSRRSVDRRPPDARSPLAHRDGEALVQAYGRSCRHAGDHGVTIINGQFDASRTTACCRRRGSSTRCARRCARHPDTSFECDSDT
jgi:hypothetical protein